MKRALLWSWLFVRPAVPVIAGLVFSALCIWISVLMFNASPPRTKDQGASGLEFLSMLVGLGGSTLGAWGIGAGVKYLMCVVPNHLIAVSKEVDAALSCDKAEPERDYYLRAVE
jgi:hypothetical protein